MSPNLPRIAAHSSEVSPESAAPHSRPRTPSPPGQKRSKAPMMASCCRSHGAIRSGSSSSPCAIGSSTDYAGTLQAVAKIGFKQVQPTMNYGGKTPAEVKAILDQNGLTAPATHVSPPNGPDFEKTLDDYAAMGHKYTTVNVGGEGRGRGACGRGRHRAGAQPAPARARRTPDPAPPAAGHPAPRPPRRPPPPPASPRAGADPRCRQAHRRRTQ